MIASPSNSRSRIKWAITRMQLVCGDGQSGAKFNSLRVMDLSQEFCLALAQLPARAKAWQRIEPVSAADVGGPVIDSAAQWFTFCSQLLGSAFDLAKWNSQALLAKDNDTRSSIFISLEPAQLPAWLLGQLKTDVVNSQTLQLTLALDFAPMPVALKLGLPVVARLCLATTQTQMNDSADKLANQDVHTQRLHQPAIHQLAEAIFHLLQCLKQRQHSDGRYWYAKNASNQPMSRIVRLEIVDTGLGGAVEIEFEQGQKAPTPWPWLASADHLAQAEPAGSIGWQGFLPVIASSKAQLIAKLTALLTQLQQAQWQDSAPHQLMAQLKSAALHFSQASKPIFAAAFNQADSDKAVPRACVAVLVAKQVEHLSDEISHLLARLIQQDKAQQEPQKSQNQGCDGYVAPITFDPITTPNGSVCRSLAQSLANGLTPANLCFVYPGVGTCYAGQFDGLSRYFPVLYQRLDSQGDLSELLADKHFGRDGQGTDQLTTLAQAGVGSAWLLSQWLQDEWQISPRFAFGYSLGEVSMWAGLGLWQSPQILGERLRSSAAFTQGITGALQGVARLWGQALDRKINWASYSVRSPAKLAPWLAPNDKAWLAINHGDSGILQGDSARCAQILSQSGCRAVKVGFVTAMHTPAAQFYHDEIKTIFTLDLADKGHAMASSSKPIQLFSSGQYQRVAINTSAISQSISDCFCQPLDFEKLAKQVHAAGARVFIEVGAGRACTTYLDKIYADLPHLCLATNSKGQTMSRSLLGLLAQLISLGFAINLAPLFGPYDYQSISQSQDSVI
ncbi:PfaB family protein [Motilimonas sp. KMU-193]|uniref:PfaB family protein n=1 Tax=Motilimonas sp. KMU-193 TaxID=3388668 RepID=UPI00396B33F1